MGRRSSDVASKDVRINPGMEEYASSMVQRSSDAASKDVRINPGMEECAVSTEQCGRNDAALKNAQI